jgi:hypothetical protein
VDLGVHLPLMQLGEEELSLRRLQDAVGTARDCGTPERFADARAALPDGFPNALATMWTWVSEDRAEGDRVLAEVLAPILARDPEELQPQVCVGPAGHCAELLSRYAEAGCGRVYLWPLGDERRQLELVAAEVAPQLA